MPQTWVGKLEKIDAYRWRIPKTGAMRVPGVIYTSQEMIDATQMEKTSQQVANVATLQGIERYSLAMPDIHWGYGFPIGGVAAMDIEQGGVITPGGIGFDINCGCRVIRSSFKREDIQDVIPKLVAGLFTAIPSGVGSEGRIRISKDEIKKVLETGAKWAERKGYGPQKD